MTTFQPGDRVWVAEDAMCSGTNGVDVHVSLAQGKDAFVADGPDADGDYRLRIDGEDFYFAHGRFLTLITDDPDPQEDPMPEYIDPSTLPEGWTLCEVSNHDGDTQTYLECNRAGRYRCWTSEVDGVTLPAPWSIVRVIDQTPDLPVIEYDDIPTGATYEVRQRRLRDSNNGAGEVEYRLVSLPTPPDPDAELFEEVRGMLNDLAQIPADTFSLDVLTRDLIDLVRINSDADDLERPGGLR